MTHFNIPPMLLSFSLVVSYNVGTVLTLSSGSVKTSQADLKLSEQTNTNKKEELWSHCNLTVQCTCNKCQVNMGTILVLMITLKCANTGSMECVMIALIGLNKQKHGNFLKKASKEFSAQMVKRTASQEWDHSTEDTKHFAVAMQEAQNQVLKDQHWKLTKDHSHNEMAHAALVAFNVMQSMLLKVHKHPK